MSCELEYCRSLDVLIIMAVAVLYLLAVAAICYYEDRRYQKRWDAAVNLTRPKRTRR